jgi:hypothetical protein
MRFPAYSGPTGKYIARQSLAADRLKALADLTYAGEIKRREGVDVNICMRALISYASAIVSLRQQMDYPRTPYGVCVPLSTRGW